WLPGVDGVLGHQYHLCREEVPEFSPGARKEIVRDVDALAILSEGWEIGTDSAWILTRSSKINVPRPPGIIGLADGEKNETPAVCNILRHHDHDEPIVHPIVERPRIARWRRRRQKEEAVEVFREA